MKLAALILVLANLACLPFGNQPAPRKVTHNKGLTPYQQQGVVLQIRSRGNHLGRAAAAASRRKDGGGSQSPGAGPMD